MGQHNLSTGNIRNLSDFRVDTVKIDPETAAIWLKKNASNRKWRESASRALAAAIKRGEWILNGEAIKFSKDGYLLDGQHRLHAIIMSGIACQCLVIWGVSAAAFDTMDQGMKRTAGDALYIKGEKDANNLAAIARLYMILKANPESPDLTASYTPRMVEAVVNTHPELRFAVHAGQKINKISTVSIGGAMWAAFQEKNRTLANEFFDRLADGAGLNKYSPIKVLRDALMVDKVSVRKLQKRDVIAYYIKAWNALRSGKEIRILRMTGDEAFPVII